ncbi:unnamed protein product [Trichobilharzia szidati]|nr:unnamed protein product [Trichobilharzia szidati]
MKSSYSEKILRKPSFFGGSIVFDIQHISNLNNQLSTQRNIHLHIYYTYGWIYFVLSCTKSLSKQETILRQNRNFQSHIFISEINDMTLAISVKSTSQSATPACSKETIENLKQQ